jgi:hypothetical protein
MRGKERGGKGKEGEGKEEKRMGRQGGEEGFN